MSFLLLWLFEAPLAPVEDVPHSPFIPIVIIPLNRDLSGDQGGSKGVDTENVLWVIFLARTLEDSRGLGHVPENLRSLDHEDSRYCVVFNEDCR